MLSCQLWQTVEMASAQPLGKRRRKTATAVTIISNGHHQPWTDEMWSSFGTQSTNRPSNSIKNHSITLLCLLVRSSRLIFCSRFSGTIISHLHISSPPNRKLPTNSLHLCQRENVHAVRACDSDGFPKLIVNLIIKNGFFKIKMDSCVRITFILH